MSKAKKTRRFKKKWLSHILDLIDGLERRITVLEAQMREVDKFIANHHSKEEWLKFMKWLKEKRLFK